MSAESAPGELHELADGVWAWVQPEGTWWVNTAGAVSGDDGLLIVDTCATERRTRACLTSVEWPGRVVLCRPPPRTRTTSNDVLARGPGSRSRGSVLRRSLTRVARHVGPTERVIFLKEGDRFVTVPDGYVVWRGHGLLAVTDSRALCLGGWAAGLLFLQQTSRVPVLAPLGSVMKLTAWCRPSGPCVAYFEKTRHVPVDDVVRGNSAGYPG